MKNLNKVRSGVVINQKLNHLARRREKFKQQVKEALDRDINSIIKNGALTEDLRSNLIKNAK